MRANCRNMIHTENDHNRSLLDSMKKTLFLGPCRSMLVLVADTFVPAYGSRKPGCGHAFFGKTLPTGDRRRSLRA
jgi:hypothetical protein